MPESKEKIEWRGEASLKRMLVPVDEVIPHPENARRGNLDLISESLDHFGQLRPILVNKRTNYIVAGNHTYRAATERLGWNRIARVVADLDEEKERQYLLMDNRSSDVGEYDDEMRLRVLRELSEAGALVGTGYTPDDVDDLIAERDRVAETARQQFEGDYSETPEEIEARTVLRQGGAVMREVVLTYEPDRYESFQGWVRMLRREWDTGGVMDTVFEAVKRSAEGL